ncbi:phage integrase SAM-like domain-containing protein [Prevotella sp.]|uniref:phage integrase SAM-like domain-containing protein n=1 Tax=Prevotella sp. TaxID=59823 RepID=UPI0035AF00BB
MSICIWFYTLLYITYISLENYQRWLCQRGLCMNTISAYMRSLRTLYNRSVCNDGNGAVSLFGNVYTGRAHTAKHSINASCLQQTCNSLLRLWVTPR